MNKILVVDGDDSMRMLYSEELAEEGYEVIATGDSTRVMGLIDGARPDLVILDTRLGRSNGLDLLLDIRNLYYDLPVILYTCYPVYRRDMRSIAADYYVLKSSRLTELKHKVKMALEGPIQSLSCAATEDALVLGSVSMDQSLFSF